MQPLLIGPYSLGVHTNAKPFMIPDEAFPYLNNMMVWRDRLQRFPGSELLGRLRRVFTATNLAGGVTDATLTIDVLSELGVTETNAELATGFSIVIGTQTLTDTGTGELVLTPVDSPISYATVNYSTGEITLSWDTPAGPFTPVFTGAYYPTLPCMGIRIYETIQPGAANASIFFDTKYAYQYSAGVFTETPNAYTWSGQNYNQFATANFEQRNSLPLFWATNYTAGLHSYLVTEISGKSHAAGIARATITTTTAHNFSADENVSLVNMSAGVTGNTCYGIVESVGGPTTFVIRVRSPTDIFTNIAGITGIASGDPPIQQNTTGDGIRLWDGSSWYNFNPAVNGTTVLAGGLLLAPFKGRMIVLSTLENNNSGGSATAYPQRARWSENGTAWHGGIAWRDDIPGRGGYVDAATNESIVAINFVNDNLIVYFERSTWQLVYTGNEVLPFTWLRISTELGAEAPFVSVPLGDTVVALGNVGIHACNGSSVQRIDAVIPDEVFFIHNGSDGPLRSSGIRDFFQEVVYFAYASQNDNTDGAAGKIFYPSKFLVYNYRNNTFSFADKQATTLGYFQKEDELTWDQLDYLNWNTWDTPWNSGLYQSGFPLVAYGNQQGYVSVLLPQDSNVQSELTVRAISGNTITSPQHGLYENQYVKFTGCSGTTILEGNIYEVIQIVDEDTFVIDETDTGTYFGAGSLVIIPNIAIQTKAFRPYWEGGMGYTLNKMDVLFDKTSVGELHFDVYIDFNTSITQSNADLNMGTNKISTAPELTSAPYYQYQQFQNQIWKRHYPYAMGQTFQLQFSLDDDQMRDEEIALSDIVIHGMVLFFEQAGEFI